MVSNDRWMLSFKLYFIWLLSPEATNGCGKMEGLGNGTSSLTSRLSSDLFAIKDNNRFDGLVKKLLQTLLCESRAFDISVGTNIVCE